MATTFRTFNTGYKDLLNNTWNSVVGNTKNNMKNTMFKAAQLSSFNSTNINHFRLFLNMFDTYAQLVKKNPCTNAPSLTHQNALTSIINNVLSANTFSQGDKTSLQGIVDILCHPSAGTGTGTSSAIPSAAASAVAASAASGVPTGVSLNFNLLMSRIFIPPTATQVSDIQDADLTDNQLDGIFSIIYEGKSQNRTGRQLTSYLQKIREFFVKLFQVPDSSITDAQWEIIAKGIKKVAEQRGIKNQYEQQALDTVKSSKRYEATLNYLKLKLQYVMTNDDNKKRKLQEKMEELASPAYNMVMRSNKTVLDNLVQQIQDRLGTLEHTAQSQRIQIESDRAALNSARASVAAASATPAPAPAPARSSSAASAAPAPAPAGSSSAAPAPAPAPAPALKETYPGVNISFYPLK